MNALLAKILFFGVVLVVAKAGNGGWAQWSDWQSSGECGAHGATMETFRTRTRIHNKARGQKQVKEEVKCLPIEMLVIHLPEYYYAPTGGDLTMKIKQGNNECQTSDPTWKGVPTENKSYYEKPVGCPNTFNPDLPFELWVTSSSGNNMYVDKMGVEIGGKWHYWSAEKAGKTLYGRHMIMIDYQYGNGWWKTNVHAPQIEDN